MQILAEKQSGFDDKYNKLYSIDISQRKSIHIEDDIIINLFPTCHETNKMENSLIILLDVHLSV